ncbi:MAG: hypothetical protein WC736_05560 [Gallionella sp.]|jgi:general secretion pathway protein G
MKIRQCGLTLIDFAVSVIIALILLGIFVNRMQLYQEQAEKTAMEGMAATLASAFSLQYGQLLTHGGHTGALLEGNPLNWLTEKPKNYSGEFFDPAAGRIEAGNWFFDLKSRELVYVVRNAAHFKVDQTGLARVRFHVASSDRLLSAAGSPGLKFKVVEPYEWFSDAVPVAGLEKGL